MFGENGAKMDREMSRHGLIPGSPFVWRKNCREKVAFSWKKVTSWVFLQKQSFKDQTGWAFSIPNSGPFPLNVEKYLEVPVSTFRWNRENIIFITLTHKPRFLKREAHVLMISFLSFSPTLTMNSPDTSSTSHTTTLPALTGVPRPCRYSCGCWAYSTGKHIAKARRLKGSKGKNKPFFADKPILPCKFLRFHTALVDENKSSLKFSEFFRSIFSSISWTIRIVKPRHWA
jgi:hypothetical protein